MPPVSPSPCFPLGDYVSLGSTSAVCVLPSTGREQGLSGAVPGMGCRDRRKVGMARRRAGRFALLLVRQVHHPDISRPLTNGKDQFAEGRRNVVHARFDMLQRASAVMKMVDRKRWAGRLLRAGVQVLRPKDR